MKTVGTILIIIAGLFIFSSCENHQKSELIHSYLPFNAPVSCIAASSQHKNFIFYVGLENGVIIKINIINNKQEIINAGNNRIYDIYEENDTVLWVGIRNEGAKRIITSSNSSKQYSIVDPNENTKTTIFYAPYSIEINNDTLYFATSSGIYTLNKNEWERVSVLNYPPLYRPEKHRHYHFGINQMFFSENSIYAATADSGLVVLDRRNLTKRKQLTSKEVFHFNKYNDSILYASSNDSIYEINMKQAMKQHKVSPVKNGDNIFAYIDTLGGKWILTSTEMVYEDVNGSGSLRLSDKLSSSYKNYIHKGHDFILVACHDKLYIFSLHQNLKGKSNNVIAACTDEDGVCYFITLDNKLYFVQKGSTVAKLKGNLNSLKGKKPIKLYAGKKYLWLITNNSLYKINPDKTLFRNVEISHEIGVAGSSARTKLGNIIDFRSIHETEDSLLFLGTRNYLLKAKFANDNIYIDSIGTKENTRIDYTDLYITDIDKFGKYFSSLKHGIFKLEGDLLGTIINSDTIGEISRFIKNTDEGSYVYTSNGVYKWNRRDSFSRQNISPKSVLTVYDRDSGFFVIGYKGITATKDKEDTLLFVDEYLDISINEAAIAEIVNNKGTSPFIYIGSQTGLYRYNGNNNPIPIEILPQNYFWYWMIAVVVLIAFSVILILYFFRRQKQYINNRLIYCEEKISESIKKKMANELNKEKEALRNRLDIVKVTSICKLRKDMNAFEKQIEKYLLKRSEVISSIKELINNKISEIFPTVVNNDECKKEWSYILSEKEKIENEHNDEYSIDHSFDLYNMILDFEKRHFKKAMINFQRKSLEIPEKELHEPLKTKIDQLAKAVKEKNPQEIKKLCEEILKSHKDISIMFSKLSYLENSMEINRKHIALLYFIKGIMPKNISRSAIYLTQSTKYDDQMFRNEISQVKYQMGIQMKELLMKEIDLPKNSNICYLYNRVKGKDKSSE